PAPYENEGAAPPTRPSSPACHKSAGSRPHPRPTAVPSRKGLDYGPCEARSCLSSAVLRGLSRLLGPSDPSSLVPGLANLPLCHSPGRNSQCPEREKWPVGVYRANSTPRPLLRAICKQIGR